jgi:hypothetical protein
MIWIAINPISSVVHPVISGRDLDRDPTWGLPPLPAQLLSNSDERPNPRPSPPVCLQYKQLRLTRRCIFCSVWPPFFPVSCYFGIGCPEERPAPSLLSTDARFLSQPPSNQSRRTGNRSNNLQSTMAHVLSCWASRNAHAHRLDTHCRLLHAALSMTRDGTLASPLPGTVNVANQQSACAPRGLALSRARLVFDFGRPVCTCGAMWHFRPKM